MKTEGYKEHEAEIIFILKNKEEIIEINDLLYCSILRKNLYGDVFSIIFEIFGFLFFGWGAIELFKGRDIDQEGLHPFFQLFTPLFPFVMPLISISCLIHVIYRLSDLKNGRKDRNFIALTSSYLYIKNNDIAKIKISEIEDFSENIYEIAIKYLNQIYRIKKDDIYSSSDIIDILKSSKL